VNDNALAGNTPLAGKTALVTGGARRLGRSIADTLAARGCGIIVHYHSSAMDAERAVAAIHKYGVPAAAIQADLADPAQVETLWSEAQMAAQGRVEILVNSAAVFPADDLSGFAPETLHETLRLNTIAPLLLSRMLAAQQVPGAIVHILDARMDAPLRRHLSYGLSKQLLADLTRLMALEYAPLVRVNAVAPGLILPPPGMKEAERERLARMNLLARWGEPADVARAVLYLVESPFVTGQVLFVDGGGTLQSGPLSGGSASRGPEGGHR
jgi:NAD(P)-dependent dehydrogenase (short-subunit alcohol dehydrogenase family)